MNKNSLEKLSSPVYIDVHPNSETFYQNDKNGVSLACINPARFPTSISVGNGGLKFEKL